MILGFDENNRRKEAVRENYKRRLGELLEVEGDLSADQVWDLVRMLNGLKPDLDDMGLQLLIEQLNRDSEVIRVFSSRLEDEKFSLSAAHRKELGISELIKAIIH